MTSIPATMRAVQLRAYDGNPESVAVVEVPMPRPGPGQVLIRVAASPINPSDLMFIRGLYGFKKPLPATPGFEGSGTVVEAGSGMMPRFLKGRRVACTAADPTVAGGMWAEYLGRLGSCQVSYQKNACLRTALALAILRATVQTADRYLGAMVVAARNSLWGSSRR
ncbi:MAG: alcohol dehydrogenase catalytic domain-containing protein [Candidatus Sulfotelmatobacter sp.]